MKRYWLFIAPRYYPNSGMHDFYNSYDHLNEAGAIIFIISQSKDGEYINYYDPSDLVASIWDSLECKIIHKWNGEMWEDYVPEEDLGFRENGSFVEPRL